MRKIVALSLALVALSALAGAGEEAPTTESKETPAIKWYASYGDAKAQAPENKSIIMLVFTSQQCPWCDRLKEETLKNAGVVQAVEGFRNVLLASDSTEYTVLARKFRLQGVPHTAFIDDDGGVLVQVPGFAPPEAFLKRIEQAKEARKWHRDKVAAFKRAPGDPKAAIAVLESLVSPCTRSLPVILPSTSWSWTALTSVRRVIILPALFRFQNPGSKHIHQSPGAVRQVPEVVKRSDRFPGFLPADHIR